MVDALAAMAAQRRIVVAGEMLELGPAGEEMHRQAGQHIAEKKIDVLLGVRGLAQAMVEAARQAGMRGRVCGGAGGSRRMAGARSARWRRGFVEGFARREAGEGAGDLEGAAGQAVISCHGFAADIHGFFEELSLSV